MSTPIPDCPEGQSATEQPDGRVICVVDADPIPGPSIPDCTEGQSASEQSNGDVVCVVNAEPIPGPSIPDCEEGQATEQSDGSIVCDVAVADVAEVAEVVTEVEPATSSFATVEQVPTPQPVAELPATGSESFGILIAVVAIAMGGALRRVARR